MRKPFVIIVIKNNEIINISSNAYEASFYF